MIKTHILDAGIIYALITGKDNSVLKGKLKRNSRPNS